MIRKIKENKYIMICFLLVLVICIPFICSYIRGDDTIFHLLNIEMINKSSIFSKILPGLNNNMGSGIGIFYPCFPHALGAIILKIISIFGLGVIDAIKIVKIIFVILSMLSMYYTANKIYKSQKKAMFDVNPI